MEITSDPHILFESLFEGVFVLDRDRRIVYWNRAAEEISGYPAAEVLGKTCRDNILVHLDEEGNNVCHTPGCPIEQAFSSGRLVEIQAFLQHRAGHRVWVEIRTIPVPGPDGQVHRVIEIFQEKAEVVRYRNRIAELERLSLLDPLTGLANRRYAEITLNSRLLDFKRYSWPLGLLFADIDKFKAINDQHGHDAGDHALVTVARTLSNTIRSSDFVSRWGGEEFVAIVFNIQENELFPLADKLRRFVEKSFFPVAGVPRNLTISIGATMARAEDSPQSLLKRADTLMYQCKQSGGNCVQADFAPGPGKKPD